MDRPVIILGGGIWGSLLAWRLKEALPHIKFRLYEESSSLGNHISCKFRESDCAASMKWLRPLISKSWNQHHIKFPAFEKWITSPYHMIESEHLHEVVGKRISEELRLNNTLTPEFALSEGSFVIDTRNTCYYRQTGFRKHLSLHVELCEDHNLIAPVILDSNVVRKDCYRSLSYFPMSEKRIVVCDTWYSENQRIDLDEMRRALCEAIYTKGWRINRIIREESGFSELPVSAPNLREEGKVISLAGLFHDTTGCSIAAATKLIEKMVATSFRYGELKEVVSTFRKEREKDRQFFRSLNRQLLEHPNAKVFEAVYSAPAMLMERFSRGNLTFRDRSRIFLGLSQMKVGGFVNFMLPYNWTPWFKLLKTSE